MNQAIYFVQECSTCGRRLEVRVELLGRQVECPHCHSQFLAREPQAAQRGAPVVSDSEWAARADRLLSLTSPSRAAS